MSGVFYGVGTGPGDPELMTVKALRIIQQCGVLVIPVSGPEFTEPVFDEEGDTSDYREYLERCVAYRIITGAGAEAEKKPKLFLPMPMMKEKERLKAIHNAGALAAAQLLDQGLDLAFITLGDPAVYSTCMYIHKRIRKMGYQTEVIPGITSFCAAAARMNISLVENSEELHVIPASYEIERGLSLPGTKVLMKAGRKIPSVKQKVKETGKEIWMVENCGMETERICRNCDEIPDEAGYYSLFIVKDAKEQSGGK